MSDVVIVGGGVVGCASAYFLTRAQPGLTVTVIEPDPAHRASATARSAGGVRQQFSTPENIALSQFTLQIIRDPARWFGEGAEIVFKEQGYLILASGEGRNILAENHAVQRAAGGDIALIEGPEAIGARFDWIEAGDLAAGAFGRSGEGWIDPVGLMALFRNAATTAGARFVTGTVSGLGREGARLTSVRLASGAVLDPGSVVIAAGPWSGQVAGLAGVPLPVEPRKRYIYVFDCRDAPESLHSAPLTVDPSGVWFRPEGRQFICGLSPDEAEEPVAEDLDTIDHAFFEERIWPALAARVPVFEAIRVTGAWAGFYDYNTLDQNAVIGRHPEIVNLVMATGFSGHGLQQAAAAGRAVSELLTEGGFRTIDLTRFGYDRIARGAPLFERNVI